MRMSDAQKTALRADICRSGLSIAELADKQHCSKSTVKNFKKDLANQPGQLATLPSTAPIGQVAKAKLGRIILDTQARRVGLTVTVEEQQNIIQAQMKRGTIDMDLLKAYLATTKTLMDLYKDYDAGELIAANLKGPDATRPCKDCIEHLKKTPDLLEQLFETMNLNARHKIVGKIIEETLDLLCSGCRRTVLENLAPSPGPAIGPPDIQGKQEQPQVINPEPTPAPPIAEAPPLAPALHVAATPVPPPLPPPVEAPALPPAATSNLPPSPPPPPSTEVPSIPAPSPPDQKDALRRRRRRELIVGTSDKEPHITEPMRGDPSWPY